MGKKRKEKQKQLKRVDQYRVKGKYELALKEALKAYKWIKAGEDVHQLYEHLLLIGELYQQLGMYQEAQHYYIEAIDLQQNLSINLEEQKKVYLELINVIALEEDGELLQFYIKKANDKGLLTAREQLALYKRLSVNLNKKTDVETCLKACVDLVIELKMSDTLAHSDSLLSLGTFYYENQQYALGMHYLTQGVEIYQKLIKAPDYLLEAYLMLATMAKHLKLEYKYEQYYRLATEIDAIGTKNYFKYCLKQ